MSENPISPSFLLAWGSGTHSGHNDFEECARVTAPTLIRPEDMTPDSERILSYSTVIAQRTGNRLLFFSELSATLADKGQSWGSQGVDWEAGLNALEMAPIPMLYLSLSYQGWVVVNGGARELTIFYSDGPVTLNAATERDRLREGITQSVYADWAAYIKPML